MTGTLLVKADGTSCEATIGKMSVDLPNKAARCQRILSGTAHKYFGAEAISDATGDF
jgi:hypothetical protein